jgi:hypothetical protein
MQIEMKLVRSSLVKFFHGASGMEPEGLLLKLSESFSLHGWEKMDLPIPYVSFEPL